MCIVIDTNVFSSVFHDTSPDHQEYKPVKDWITTGRGFLVYGGSKYKKELKNARKYLAIFGELQKQGKVKQVDHSLVDQHQRKVERIICDKNCDDTHLIAIFRVSSCCLLCSNDKRGDRFIKNRSLYLQHQKPPSIYRSKKHRRLLCDRHIVNIQHVVQ